jgi:hypothetical protein
VLAENRAGGGGAVFRVELPAAKGIRRLEVA